MDTKEKLEIALKEALKAGDDVRKRTVRMVLAAVRQVAALVQPLTGRTR